MPLNGKAGCGVAFVSHLDSPIKSESDREGVDTSFKPEYDNISVDCGFTSESDNLVFSDFIIKISSNCYV